MENVLKVAAMTILTAKKNADRNIWDAIIGHAIIIILVINATTFLAVNVRLLQ